VQTPTAVLSGAKFLSDKRYDPIKQKIYSARYREKHRAEILRRDRETKRSLPKLDKSSAEYRRVLDLKNAAKRRRYAKDPEKHRRYTREWCALKGPEQRAIYYKRWLMKEGSIGIRRATYLKKQYGVTVDDYVTIYEAQNGRCAICDAEGSDIRTCREYRTLLCVDHDHRNDRIRGLLCHKCNRGIGHFSDNGELLENAAYYVRGSESLRTVAIAIIKRNRKVA
jgi:hypothetical protein